MKASYVIKHLTGTLVFFVILFVCAGRADYLPGLIYLAISLFMFLLNYTVLRLDPDLLEERSKPAENTKKWDKTILLLSFVLTLAMYCVAGLDSGRFHWSPPFHIELNLAGGILVATGQLLFLIAQKQNHFFSSTVRIQNDRKQTVCDTGLYKFVRHPAYLGNIIQNIGFPLLLGSLWSIIPALLLSVLIILRTCLEDRLLRNELEGYQEYTAKTTCRLIPYIW